MAEREESGRSLREDDLIGTSADVVLMVDEGDFIERLHRPPSAKAFARVHEGAALGRIPLPRVVRDDLQGAVTRARHSGEVVTFDAELETTDGVHLHHVTARKIDDRVICLVRDDDAIVGRRMGRDVEMVRLASALGAYVWSADISPEGTFSYRYYSSGAELITGYPAIYFEEGGPERWLATVHPEDRPRIGDAADAVMTQNLERLIQEYRSVWPDGRVVWLRDHAFIDQLPSGGRRITGLVLDITDRRRMESELLQMQKEESLGLLAGGIAHDFNNLLMTILRGAEHAQKRVADSGAQEALSMVVDATQRATGLCQQLLAYAGRPTGSTESVDLSKMVAGMKPMLEALAPEATVEVKVADGPTVVRADTTQLQQVLLNLATNAVQALGETGTVSLRVWRQWVDIDRLPVDSIRDGATDGHYVMLEVRDDGVGMSQRVRQRMFDPFFSTKEKGHGLGLSATLGVVRAHAGILRVDSVEGKGTTFTLAFPSVEEHARADAGPESTPSPTRGRILFVDDEASLRTLTRMVLEDEGFDVVTAADGAAALAFLDARGGDVGVVVLDLTMPGMKGVEVLQRIRASRPRLPVILSSGYPPETIAELVSGDERLGYLAKPYTMDSLLEQLTAYLDLSDG